MKCNYDDHCEINVNTRHTCSSCRLKKCFASGMKIELVQCSRRKKNIQAIALINRSTNNRVNIINYILIICSLVWNDKNSH